MISNNNNSLKIKKDSKIVFLKGNNLNNSNTNELTLKAPMSRPYLDHLYNNNKYNIINRDNNEESVQIIEDNKNKFNKTLNNFHKKIIKSPSAGNIIMKNTKYNNLSNIINKLDFPEEDFLYFNDINNLKNDLKINLFKNNSLKKQEKKNN